MSVSEGRPAPALARGLTTPPPAYAVPVLFPGIEEHAATATRLHPRGGNPDPLGSHVGGPLRWPAGEAWPTCDADHVVATEVPIPAPLLRRLERLRAAEPARRWPGYQAVLAELASRAPGFVGIHRRDGGRALYQVSRPQPVPSPLVAVAQLRAADVPDLRPPPGAPSGTDLLQVLWCPNDHDIGGGALAPAVRLRWRREADVTSVLPRPPAPAVVGHRVYLPRPCVLYPEQVVEYPWWQQLPADLGHQVRCWDAEHDGRYHRQLAAAPGWKVGGWPQWPTTDPLPLYCTRCGEAMRQLLQIDSGEWGDAERWCPLEERALRASAGAEQDAAYLAASEPTGVIAGHTGLYRIFTCPSCPGGADSPHIDLQ
ncbi:MAG TPA: hypothetical protein VLJ59_04755 [Mycobacteriales bacterium]|nr:hypothetical protein [Mycobacteriales bacterium]